MALLGSSVPTSALQHPPPTQGRCNQPRLPSRPLQKMLILAVVVVLLLGIVALIIGLSVGLNKK